MPGFAAVPGNRHAGGAARGRRTRDAAPLGSQAGHAGPTGDGGRTLDFTLAARATMRARIAVAVAGALDNDDARPRCRRHRSHHRTRQTRPPRSEPEGSQFASHQRLGSSAYLRHFARPYVRGGCQKLSAYAPGKPAKPRAAQRPRTKQSPSHGPNSGRSTRISGSRSNVSTSSLSCTVSQQAAVARSQNWRGTSRSDRYRIPSQRNCPLAWQ